MRIPLRRRDRFMDGEGHWTRATSTAIPYQHCDGFLAKKEFLILDRDSKYSEGVPRLDKGHRNRCRPPAAAFAEFERSCRAVRKVDQGRMSQSDDLLRRTVVEEGDSRLRRSLSPRKKSSGDRQSADRARRSFNVVHRHNRVRATARRDAALLSARGRVADSCDGPQPPPSVGRKSGHHVVKIWNASWALRELGWA